MRDVLLFGLLGGALLAALRLVEFRFIIVEHSVAIYGGAVAALFAAAGIWLGLRLVRPKETVVVKEVLIDSSGPFLRDEGRVERLGITPRELETLELLASGLSNREIAQRLFVSENTVKTHTSRLFAKLNVTRRTQAVQTAREQRLIP